MKMQYDTIRRFLPLLACLLLSLQAVPALAQDAEPAPAAVPAAAAEKTEKSPQSTKLTIGKMLKDGGWAMYPLGLCSIAMVGLAFANFIFIREHRLSPDALAVGFEEHLGRFDFTGANNLCDSNPSPLATILHAGLDRVHDNQVSIEEMRQGMEDAAPEVIAKTQTTINYLSVVGVISPMIGLLGTVSGMIKAFQAMALQGMGRPELFAGNISEALITTGAGLVVGIPAMALYYFFKYRFNGIMAGISRICGNTLSTLTKAMRTYRNTGAHPGGQAKAESAG
jgi:biopolymer transport protein ExbB